jgi:hypothetical protein
MSVSRGLGHVPPEAEWRLHLQTQDGTFGLLFAGRKKKSKSAGAWRPRPFAGKPAKGLRRSSLNLST